jgi:hypothetical protein
VSACETAPYLKGNDLTDNGDPPLLEFFAVLPGAGDLLLTSGSESDNKVTARVDRAEMAARSSRGALRTSQQ